MMNESVLKLKDQILSEILADLDEHEGMKLKPKAAEVSITAVKPMDAMMAAKGLDEAEPKMGDEREKEDYGSDMPPGMGADGKACDDDDDEDDLKQLLAHYSK